MEFSQVAYQGALESICSYEGRPGREIVLLYRIEFDPNERFALEVIAGAESDGTPYEAHGLPLSDVRTGGARLCPDGLLDLLDETT